ncbi:MAG TPA: ArsC family reductase [Pedobacter sp.]|jgi:Spx/MgsR family transcriptional regulator
MKVYGIKNCNTVAKALKWLDDHKVQYEFHDFKKLGISEEKLEKWSETLGWEALLNTRGTTWKQLDQSIKDSINTKAAAFALMREKNSVIKRPVVESEENLVQGFDDALYQKHFL